MSLLFYTELIVLYFFLFLSVEISSKETQRCPLYSKSSLEKRECLYKQTALRFLLQNCPKKSKCVIDKVNQTGKCQSTELEHDKPAFPSGKCKFRCCYLVTFMCLIIERDFKLERRNLFR